MATKVNFKGKPVSLKGDVLQPVMHAPDFTFVLQDLSESSLKTFAGKVIVVIAVPSLDTGVCALETKTFNKKFLEFGDKAQGIIISKDLPFAMKRFCETENIHNVLMTSDFRYNEFGERYNALMAEGPLKGLLARIVWVVDSKGNIVFTHIVDEITSEPDYQAVLEQVKKLLI